MFVLQTLVSNEHQDDLNLGIAPIENLDSFIFILTFLLGRVLRQPP